MALKPGTLEDINGSMAEAMEQVFRDKLPSVVADADPTKGEKERRLLFVAIAQGVVQHLQEHHDAFKVRVTLPGGVTADGQVTEIQ